MDKTEHVCGIIIVGLLAASVIACGGKTTAEEPSDVETPELSGDAPVSTSEVEEGDVPGTFGSGDDFVRVVVIARDPHAETQRVKLVYTWYFLDEMDADKILSELDPRLSVGGGEPVSYSSVESLGLVGFHETAGEILALEYPGGSGGCVFSVATTGGRVSVDLGAGDRACRLSKKVRPGVKVNLRAEPSTDASIVRVLEPGDFIFPTGKKELFVDAVDPDTTDWFLFQRVNTPDGEEGWVIVDDEVFKHGGYVETLP